MLYTIEYSVKKAREDMWSWYVQGLVRDMQGRAVRWSAMTMKCNKAAADRMYRETYEAWNSDPAFCTGFSGKLWRGVRLP